MRILKLLLCASALAACASSKSAERPDAEWNEPTDPMAGRSEPVAARPEPMGAESLEANEVEPLSEPANDDFGASRGAAAPASMDGARAKAADERSEPRRPAPTAAAGGDRADNTEVNERDSDERTLTPIDQGGSTSDRRITQQIRQAVVGDDSLSFTAKNVKIITVDGKVTLRGPVKSQQERATIDAAAKKVAGARVDNQLEVAK